MAFNRKNSVKLAGAVLSGTLVLTGAFPSAAVSAAESAQKTEAQQTEDKAEKVVFLNTSDHTEEKEQGPYDGQAVHSVEEALAQFGTEKEEAPAKFGEVQESEKILVLCDGSTLSAEETALFAEEGVTLTTDTAYEAEQKEKEAEAAKAAEKANEETVETEEDTSSAAAGDSEEQDTDGEISLPFIWETQKTDSSSLMKTSAQFTCTDETGDEETAYSGEETDPAYTGEISDGEDFSEEGLSEDEETEEVPVYSLFAMFALPQSTETASAETEEMLMTSAATADAGDTNALLDSEQTETAEEDTPMLLSLPGNDLVGKGTSGVGSGSSTSSSSSSNTSSGSTGSAASSGSTGSAASSGSTGSAASSGSTGTTASSGSTAGNSSSGTTASGTAASSGTAQSSSKGIIQTGDTSNRTLWGVSAGISGVLAAFFAAQWRKLRRE